MSFNKLLTIWFKVPPSTLNVFRTNSSPVVDVVYQGYNDNSPGFKCYE